MVIVTGGGEDEDGGGEDGGGEDGGGEDGGGGEDEDGVGVGVGVLLGVLLGVGVGVLLGALLVGALVTGGKVATGAWGRLAAGEECAREGEAGGIILTAFAAPPDPVGAGVPLVDGCPLWEV